MLNPVNKFSMSLIEILSELLYFNLFMIVWNMIAIVTSYSVGLASAKVDDYRECTIATCNFSPAWLYNFKISRFGRFGGSGRLLSRFFYKI